jgi:TRAP transporter 4TM/12TM fusion protein
MSLSEFWHDRPVYKRISALVAIALALFHIYTALFGSLDALLQRSVHLGMGLILTFLVHPSTDSAKKGTTRRLDGLWIAAVILVIGYIFWRYERITVDRFPLVSPVFWYETILGVVAILCVLEAARRVVSPGLLYVVVVFLVYPLVGPYLDGLLRSSPLGWTAVVEFNYLSLGGIFGIPLGVSATEIALFIIFGSVLMRSGGSQLISRIATAVAGRYMGGAAKVAVVASSMMGTITGSATANVATVGSITIPMMKKAGYSGTFAAAVEAVASCGGQLMPPVMGAAAFVMSSFSGIPYVEICYYALFPAILYYVSLFFTVDLEARRLKLKTSNVEFKLSITLREYGHMIVPIAVLLALLLAGFTPRLAGAVGILTAIAASQFQKTTRMNLFDVLSALEFGAKGMLIVCISTAAAGMICGTIDLTGLGQRFSSAFMDLTGGNLLLGLFLCMIIAILLGLGLPTTPAYIVQAATVIPALIKMGLPMPAAHLFAFYYSCLALITPPDASAAYTAASLAGANGWRTGWLATRMALVAFFIPFMFAFDQSLLLMGQFLPITGSIMTALVGTWCLAVLGEGYLFDNLKWSERSIAGVAAFCLIFPSMKLGFVGMAVMLFVALRSRSRRKKDPGIAGALDRGTSRRLAVKEPRFK